jgi:hypothetical protein
MQGNDQEEILRSYSGSFGSGSGPFASRIVLSKKCKIDASDCLKNEHFSWKKIDLRNSKFTIKHYINEPLSGSHYIEAKNYLKNYLWERKCKMDFEKDIIFINVFKNILEGCGTRNSLVAKTCYYKKCVKTSL